MKLASVIIKSAKEQIRSLWILFLTIAMAPFFVFIYYLINETTKPHYDLLLLNQDSGVTTTSGEMNYGEFLVEAAGLIENEGADIPFRVGPANSRADAIDKLKNREADALVVIPEGFSDSIHDLTTSDDARSIEIELIGDLTNINYMVGAIWANEVLNEYILEVTHRTRPVQIKETGLGASAMLDDFDLYVPGILILSVIMLMFSATIAIITEVENQTIVRLKLSTVSSLELLAGISVVQIVVGVLSVLLTLIVAVWLGFDYVGSFSIMILIAVLTSISIIAFSLINAAITRSVNEVLIVVNFPLFLFMFFTGAAFPMKGSELFSIAGYAITVQGLMSPTHAIGALNKVLILDMALADILPEISALILLTVIYFLIGVWGFQRRHMRVL